jgi:hypothetical protein
MAPCVCFAPIGDDAGAFLKGIVMFEHPNMAFEHSNMMFEHSNAAFEHPSSFTLLPVIIRLEQKHGLRMA